MIDSSSLAEWLCGRLDQFLPSELPGGWLRAGLNERMRFLCYTPGQEFAEHRDGCYMRENGHCSKVTIQLYLNDMPHEFGGATNFFPSSSTNMTGYQPEAGSCLVFTQDLPHEGQLVSNGIKYTLRTEVMYEHNT